MSVLNEVEVDVKNVSVPTEVELDDTTDPEVEKQMLSLAPSNNEGIIVNVAPTQFGDCNLASKNVSVPTEVEFDEVKNVSVPTEAENVSVPTEVELYVNTDPEGEKQMPSLAPSNNEGTIANVVSNSGDYNLVISNTDKKASIKTYKFKGHKLIKKGYFKEKRDSARVGQAKRGKIKNKKIGAPHPSPLNIKRTKI